MQIAYFQTGPMCDCITLLVTDLILLCITSQLGTVSPQ